MFCTISKFSKKLVFALFVLSSFLLWPSVLPAQEKTPTVQEFIANLEKKKETSFLLRDKGYLIKSLDIGGFSYGHGLACGITNQIKNKVNIACYGIYNYDGMFGAKDVLENHGIGIDSTTKLSYLFPIQYKTSQFKQIKIERQFGCALLAQKPKDGSTNLVCWAEKETNIPRLPQEYKNYQFDDIFLDQQKMCGLKTQTANNKSGNLVCWGKFLSKDGNNKNFSLPESLTNSKFLVVDFGVDGYFSKNETACALLAQKPKDGSTNLVCWGANGLLAANQFGAPKKYPNIQLKTLSMNKIISQACGLLQEIPQNLKTNLFCWDLNLTKPISGQKDYVAENFVFPIQKHKNEKFLKVINTGTEYCGLLKKAPHDGSTNLVCDDKLGNVGGRTMDRFPKKHQKTQFVDIVSNERSFICGVFAKPDPKTGSNFVCWGGWAPNDC